MPSPGRGGWRAPRAGRGSLFAAMPPRGRRRPRLERNLLPTVEQPSCRPRDPARRNNNWRKLMRSILAAGLIAAGAWCVGASPSVAAPANGVALGDAAGELGIAESVHCRRYVHWHSWGRGTGCGRSAVIIREGVRVRRPGVSVRVHTGDRVRSSTSIRSRESTTVRSREGATVRGGREGGGRTGQGGAAQRERSGGGGQTGTSGAGGGGGGSSTGQGGGASGGASGGAGGSSR